MTVRRSCSRLLVETICEPDLFRTKQGRSAFPRQCRRIDAMMLHNLLAAHQADPDRNRWDNGLFVSACQICGRAMVKPPGEKWQLVSKAKGR